jgi:hypothetical protein
MQISNDFLLKPLGISPYRLFFISSFHPFPLQPLLYDKIPLHSSFTGFREGWQGAFEKREDRPGYRSRSKSFNLDYRTLSLFV